MKFRKEKEFKSTLRSNSHCTNLPPEVWNDIMKWKISDNIILIPNVKDDTIMIRRERRNG
tara:strand:- start:178 stop:357 length:180 start_codon:yes stop_codon:yes gene_type:complete